MPGRYEFSLPPRPERDGWFRVGTVDVTTTALLVGLGVVSMFVYAADRSLLVEAVFAGDLVRDGEVWRLFTWPVVNPPDSIWSVLTLVFFWFFGHAVEDKVGRIRFGWLILAMTAGSAGITTLAAIEASFATYGLSILGLGLLVVFALDNPGAVFFFGIPAWALAAVYVLIDILRYTGDRAFEPLVVEMLVIGIGLIGARQCGLLEQLDFIPRFSHAAGAGAAGARRGRRSRSGRRAGRSSGPSVVTGPWEGSGRGPSPLEQAELDTLLDKISAQGMSSLTKAEKARLGELSRRLREG